MKKFIKLKSILSIMITKDTTEIIILGIFIFYQNYVNNIQKIIELYPENHSENGNLFWIESKRFPSILKFDINDSITFEFIFSFYKIYFNILNISYTDDEIKKNEKNYIIILKKIITLILIVFIMKLLI